MIRSHRLQGRPVRAATKDRHRERPVSPLVTREDANQKVLTLFHHPQPADAREPHDVAGRPVMPACPRHEKRIVHDAGVRQRQTELLLGEPQIVLGDEVTCAGARIVGAEPRQLAAGWPIEVPRLLRDQDVWLLQAAAEAGHELPVETAPLRNDHEIWTRGRQREGHGREMQQQYRGRRQVGGKAGHCGRHPRRAGEVAHRTAERPELPDPGRPAIHVCLERRYPMPLFRERDRCACPELLAPSPWRSIAAEKDEALPALGAANHVDSGGLGDSKAAAVYRVH
jgi:hypothetical protein